MNRRSVGALRASSVLSRAARLAATAALVAGTTAFAGVATGTAQTAAAAGPKVVIVVGPSGPRATSSYLAASDAYAAEARSLGATVVQVETPHATWSRVVDAARGAKVFIYLGHGNGWPSPYPPFRASTKNGLGLNPSDGSGMTSPVAYVGEARIAASLDLARGAIVLLNHLCYASGNGEPGQGTPSWEVARQRVDNYAAGFLAAGAAAVVSDAGSMRTELRLALNPRVNLLAGWRASPRAQGHERSFASKRTPGATNYLSPDNPNSGFYRALTLARPTRSVAQKPSLPAPGSAFVASAATAVNLRASPSIKARSLGIVWRGARLTITGSPRNDEADATWVPVRTAAGKKGFMAAWLLRFAGSAVPVTGLNLRAAGSTKATVRMVVTGRVTVLGARASPDEPLWVKVRTSRGVTGWVAGWYLRP